MPDSKKMNRKYERPVEIAEGIHWIGFYDAQSGLHCNPYLVIDNDEAVVIDGGSRPDFATVMLKILQAGAVPKNIKALIYQHYDPDLCGSIPNFEDIIGQNGLKILSASENMMFIRHYSTSSPLVSLSKINFQFEFASGRRLEVRTVSIGDAPVTVPFESTFAERFPVVMADISTTNGTDTTMLRFIYVSKSRVRLFIQEDQSADDETDHLLEGISLFVAD